MIAGPYSQAMRELVAACGIWLLPGGVVTLWLLGFGALLLLAVTPFRYATGGALRIFSVAVAVHALFSSIAIGIVARVAADHQNPSATLDAAGVGLAASGLVAVVACWLGRSWTPKLHWAQGLSAAIDWRREALRTIFGTLQLLVMSVFLGIGAVFWLMLTLFAKPWCWSAGSYEFGYLLAAVLALAIYALLCTGERAALRAPIRPSTALTLGLTCGSLALFLPSLAAAFSKPAIGLLHDGALVELLGDSLSWSSRQSFEDAQAELLRRRSDRAHSLAMASRKLRRTSASPTSMSARLVANESAASEPSGEAWLDFRWHGITPPELAVVDVLVARGEIQEALAWVTDPRVPLYLRLDLVEGGSLERALSRTTLIAAVGKACVDASKRATPEQARSDDDSRFRCSTAIQRLLPLEPSSLTTEEGFAIGYAIVAIGGRFSGEHPLSHASDEGAIAMLRGMHAAALSDIRRSSGTASDLKCSTFDHLAALVCSADRLSACADKAARSFQPLVACAAQLPPPTPAELFRLGGY